MIVFATDDERDDDELTVEAISLKQNVPFFKEFKERFHSIISSSKETETKTETNEASINMTL